jgi:lysophospholipase L1-like esterase
MESFRSSTVASETPPSAPRRERRAFLRLPGIRRLARNVPWRVLTAAAIVGAAAYAASQIPLRQRLRLQAHLTAMFTQAPVLLVGDSITYQAGPAQLCGAEVFNAAVPGDRVADLVADAPDYARNLAATQVVIAVGVNDAWPNHRDLADWIADYRRLVAHYAGRQLVLVEISPPDMSMPLFVKRLDFGFIAGANAAIRAIAAETGARLVPAPVRVQTRDGLHPTPAGAELWRARLTMAACG